MMQRQLIQAAAWLEIVTGIALFTMIRAACPLLLGATPNGVGVPLGQLAGIGLFALGIACLPSGERPSRSAALGLLAYNGGVLAFATWLGLFTPFHGPLLWPAVGLHAVLTALLARALTNGEFARQPA